LDNSCLTNPVRMDLECDTIRLEHNGDWDWCGKFDFGGNSIWSDAPPRGCSISRGLKKDVYYIVYAYLDASPTLGFRNDSTDAFGSVCGKLLDKNRNPVKNMEVCYETRNFTDDSLVFYSAFTDESGEFCIYDHIAEKASIMILSDNKIIHYDSFQFYPDSLTYVEIVMKNYIGVEDGPSVSIVSNYALEQNYPNPFNPATTIKFSLPEAGNVKLSVYDITGRLIETLASGFYGAGNHTITFNANNISSGLYILRADLKAHVLTRKMILIK
ncbi:MAG TPA: T9SS type A sorting domain-containing protein, partial [Ignavibacteriales bacterium]|nr:T9SS type A sorting domain-containing protein [Ignavibacteriales bacterium]